MQRLRHRPRTAGAADRGQIGVDRAASPRRRHGRRTAARPADRAGRGSQRAARQLRRARGVRRRHAGGAATSRSARRDRPCVRLGDAADGRRDAARAGAARGACGRGADGSADRRWRPRRRGAVRSLARTRGRAHARRFRRQCQPRAAHAAGLADRLHRHAARSGRRRSAGAATLPRHHGRAGGADEPADRRPAEPVAHRADRASGAVRHGRIWHWSGDAAGGGLRAAPAERSVHARRCACRTNCPR